MRLLITGATGYIGGRLVKMALSAGHTVISASRRRPDADVDWLPFDLFSDTSPMSVPSGVDAIIHLAAATGTGRGDDHAELAAARKLLEGAKLGSVKFVFVSSQTAREDAPTPYGRIKWRIEREVLASGGVVLRPGQVYGGPELGLFGVLVGAVRKLPALPAFFPSPAVQPVHVDDLSQALLRCAEMELPPSVLGIGAATPLSFTRFLQVIASVRVGRPRLWIPIPVALIRAGAWATGATGVLPGLRRLTSLFDLPPLRTAPDMALLGITLRPLRHGMHKSGDGRRRALAQEARTLLAYALRTLPAHSLVRRYVRCVESLRLGAPVGLPPSVLRFPAATALLHEAGSPAQQTELAWRLNAAVALAEASPQGARRFLSLGLRAGHLPSMLRIARAVILELSCRVLRPITKRFLRLPPVEPEPAQ